MTRRLLAAAFLATLLGGTSTSAQDEPQPCPVLKPDGPLRVTLRPETVLPGATPCAEASVTLTVAPEGPLTTYRVWSVPADAGESVEAAQPDLRLRLVDVRSGQILKDDEDSGGKPTPFIQVEATESRDLRVIVRADAAEPTAVILHLRSLPETEATLAAARSGAKDLAEIRALVDIENHAEARERVASSVAALTSLGTTTPSVTRVLYDLGDAALGSQAMQVAHDAWKLVLGDFIRTLPRDHPDTQNVRSRFAVVLKELGRMEEAVALFEQVLAVRTRTLHPDDPDLASARNDLATTLAIHGRLEEAIALHEQVLDVFSRTLPDNHRNLQVARANLALTLFTHGRTEEAKALQEMVLEVDSRTLPDDDLHLQASRNNFANTLFSQGRVEEAKALQELVLGVYVRSLPEDHVYLQMARNNLATTYLVLGRLEHAKALNEQVLHVYSGTRSEDHPVLQKARMGLSGILATQGRLEEARVLGMQVLEVWSRTLPEGHRDLQAARGNLASTLKALGRLEEAKALQDKVIEVFARTLPRDHPELQRVRMDLGSTLFTQHRLEEAKAHFEQVHEIWCRTLPGDHPDLAMNRLNLGVTLRTLGRLEEAQAQFEQVIETWTRTLPADHPHLQAARNNLALTLASLQDPAVAAVLARSLADTGLRAGVLASRAGIQGDAGEVDAALADFSWTWGLARIAGHADALRRSAARAFLAVQGVGSASRELSGLLKDAPEELRARTEKLRDRLLGVAARIAYVSQRGDTKEMKLLDLVRERERVATELNAILRSLPGAESVLNAVGPGEIAGALSPGQAAVAFWRYAPYTRNAESGSLEAGRVHYVAWVFRADGTVVDVNLGLEDDVEDLVSEWRTAVEEGRDPARSGKALFREVFAPLVPHLGKEMKEVVCTLDGALHGVPLSMLPYADGLLGERWRILVRPALRDLCVDLPWSERSPKLVALGDAMFDEEPAAVVARSGVGGYRGTDEDARRFAPLPHTAEEVESVAALFEATFGEKAQSQVLRGDGASRRRLLALLGQARFVHLATHGYYRPEPAVRGNASLIDQRTSTFGMGQAERVQGISPLSLCGIALAGANLPSNSQGLVEGLLSGEEVSSLNLAGCELFVLSACDTAKGHRGRIGRVIASLQSALHGAGSKTTICALWKVDDAATKELMTAFYENLWMRKLPKHEALWQAQQALRHARTPDGKPRHSLRNWAAWVLTGDPR